MVKLETERLILRNYQKEDMEQVHKYFSNEDVARYEDFYPMSIEEVAEMVSEWSSMDNRLVAVLKDTKELIGSVGYWIDEQGEYSIDYDFNPAYGKQGYATEAASKLLQYLFDDMKISKIYGDCDVRNSDSYQLLERLGFERIRTSDNESYKADKAGNPILISTYLYIKRKKR